MLTEVRTVFTFCLGEASGYDLKRYPRELSESDHNVFFILIKVVVPGWIHMYKCIYTILYILSHSEILNILSIVLNSYGSYYI